LTDAKAVSIFVLCESVVDAYTHTRTRTHIFVHMTVCCE